jgi:hypothetical protein
LFLGNRRGLSIRDFFLREIAKTQPIHYLPYLLIARKDSEANPVQLAAEEEEEKEHRFGPCWMNRVTEIPCLLLLVSALLPVMERLNGRLRNH